jgi:hypothetical protein
MLRLQGFLALICSGIWMGCVSGQIGEAETGGAGGSGGEPGGSGGQEETGGSGGETAGSGGSGGSETGSGGSGEVAQPCSVDGVPGLCIDVGTCIDGGVAIPGYCAGTKNVQCCVHGAVTCDPDVQVLPNGGLAEAAGIEGCPPGMIRVEAFCIDQFEASLVTLDGEPWSPYFNPGAVEVRAVSLEGAVPQAYVSGVQAEQACKNAGKRLCTDDEWLRACQGPDGTTYPYGNKDVPGVCNDARKEHPAIEYYGTDASWIWGKLGNACIDQLHDSLDRCGQRPGCVTYEGAFDMMGNLHEWTADPEGTFRGGYYVDTVKNGPGCLYATTAHTTTYWDYSTGFRCCADLP